MAHRLLEEAGAGHGGHRDMARQVLAWETGARVPRAWVVAYTCVFGLEEAELFASAPVPVTFGGKMLALMAEHGLSLRKLAKIVHYDPRQCADPARRARGRHSLVAYGTDRRRPDRGSAPAPGDPFGELHTLLDLASAVAPGNVIPGHPGTVSPARVHFAESWVYAGAGDEARADHARDRVLAPARDYQYTANVQLHEALCTVARGGTDQGVRQAATVLDTLPPPHHSHMITETGRLVLRAVPLEQRRRPAVTEFQQVLTGTAPIRPALHPGTSH
jgi:hypothetical protein